MRFLLSSLLVASFCEPPSWGACIVTQSPDVSVMEGETINITCCWTEQFDRLNVSWTKNQKTVKTKQLVYRNSSERKNCSDLTFKSIKSEDSGNYTCKLSVDIPRLFVTEGSGTLITVTAKNNAKNNQTEGSHPDSSNHLIIGLGAVAPLLLFTLIGFCVMKRKQALAARVIYEVPHIDSEVADMDKHSTGSSTGSTQWCQVPVYESFDYFERVQTKPFG